MVSNEFVMGVKGVAQHHSEKSYIFYRNVELRYKGKNILLNRVIDSFLKFNKRVVFVGLVFSTWRKVNEWTIVDLSVLKPH